MRNLKMIAIALGMAVGMSANASELLLTTSAAKSGNAVTAVDFINDDNAVGLQLNIAIPKDSKIDLSRFAQNLPKGFSALTNIVGEELIVLIVNDTNETLPAGLNSLGVISARGGKGSFELINLVAVNAAADTINVKSVKTDASK